MDLPAMLLVGARHANVYTLLSMKHDKLQQPGFVKIICLNSIHLELAI